MDERAPALRMEEKYRLLQHISHAANSQLDFAGVLEAVARELVPVVPLDAVAVVTLKDGRLRLHALHLPGTVALPGESFEETIARAWRERYGEHPPQGGEELPIEGTGTEYVGRTRRAYVCQDLQSEARFVEDERLRSYRICSYVRTPLIVRDRLIGCIAFNRLTPRPFSPEEVALLEDVSPPIATAVSNSLAYREIAELKDQLQTENVVLREELDERGMFEEIVGSSAALRPVLERSEKVAPTESTVLIYGETGTGKELLARAIHRRSPRAARAMVKVNCAALAPSLIASELFGHEKGAFTGATQRRIGRFELAAGGSIFLDEVGELPAEVQVALLRVLQEKEFERVGGTRSLRTDARVIAATHRDLRQLVSQGRFREDLFYRLNVFPIELPPLRKRRDDIPTLVEYFVARHAARAGKKFDRIDRSTMERLLAYPWPGNVRELENVIERAVILSEGRELRIEQGSLRAAPAPDGSGSWRGTAGGLAADGAPLDPAQLKEQERRMIERALRETHGRVSGPRGAALLLGMPSTTLESKIRKLRIDKYRYRSGASAR